MATGRTGIELKVFLEGSKGQYNEFIRDNGADGVLFFDKDNHAVYAKDQCIIQSNIKDVTYNPTSTELTITPFTGTPVVINLGIQSELEGLETTLKTWVGNNYVTKTTFNNEISKKVDKATGFRLMSESEGDKLAGIDEGAQTNRDVTVNGDILGLDSEYNKSTIKMSGNLVTAPNNGEDSEVEFNLSHKYVAAENKIYFFNSATAPTTGTEGYIFAIDTSDFVQAGMINNVEYNSVTGELNITFPTIQTDGTLKDTTVKVDLSKLVDVYKAGNGLTATVGTDGTTFTVVLGDGLAFDANKAITLSLGSGLSIDNSGKLVVDFASNGVTSINGMGGGAYTINTEGVTVGTTGNVLRPIEVVNDSAAKKLKIKARPADMLAQFFRENNEDATSGIRARGAKITEAADGNPYSMIIDFTPKVWQF